MTPQELGSKLRAGDYVFGTLLVSPSPQWPAVVRDSGLDFVFIDTEHIALNRETVSWMCRTYQAMGLPPLVPIPEDLDDRGHWDPLDSPGCPELGASEAGIGGGISHP